VKNAEDAAQNIENKELYKMTTVLLNTRQSKNHPVKDKKRELLTGWEGQASGWCEHFSEMLNPEISKEKANESLSVMN
jgi:hypothetical protein